ncbi:MAG: heparinase II/III family protein [Clostridia bacterium]|nr:heparinase II/III family protein [Clostridia bacterium]
MKSLYNEFKKYDLKNILKDFNGSLVFPDIRNRCFWDSVPEEAKSSIVNDAESNICYSYHLMAASRILEFSASGDRKAFEDEYFENRIKLCIFILAECIENKGRFVYKIIDGLWGICEESCWALPAHYFMANDNCSLPDVTIPPIIDLYACETAQMLSVSACVLKPLLDGISEVFYKRILFEVNRRVIQPYIMQNDVFWMGFTEKNAVNNWNPWCNCNCMIAALLSAQNDEDRVKAVSKAIKSADVFYMGYGDDGGCDEGAGYWDRAAAALFELLDMLAMATDGTICFKNDEKLAKMGAYIKNVAITYESFVNFADARPNTRVRGDIVYRFGKYVNDKKLMAFGASHECRESGGLDWSEKISITLSREIFMLGVLNEMKCFKYTAEPESAVYMKDIHVMVARSQKEYGKGLVLAAKFGHNNEAHNHNDVGSFVVYKDGNPVFIDVGVGVYTSKTFSDKRYEIWYMQSNYHNTPIIAECGQRDGINHRDADCIYECGDSFAALSGNIEKAYELPFDIKWRRGFCLKDNRIIISDSYSSAEPFKKEFVFMACVRPEICCGEVKVGECILKCDNAEGRIETEEIYNDDILLKPCWGEKIYRIKFIFKPSEKSGLIKFNIT